MLKEIAALLLKDKATESVLNFSYALGKWIYLIDAVDDFEKDLKKGCYNVFNNLYSDIKDKETFLKEKRNELEEIFGTILSDIAAYSSRIEYKFNTDLINNILLCGLTAQTKRVLENKKWKNTMKY